MEVKMFWKKTKDLKETIVSLDGFIQQFYWGESITTEQSKRNIEEGLIQIIGHEKQTLDGSPILKITYSNGLLITEDGYFLTARHCVDGNISNTNIKDKNGITYSVETVCAISKEGIDIALAKAKIKGDPKPMNYKFYDTDQLEPGLPVALLSYDLNGKLEKRYGKVKDLHSNNLSFESEDEKRVQCMHQFVSDIPSKKGCSGGAIISPDGRLIGILSGGTETPGITTSVGLIKTLELVDFYKRKLLEKLG